MTPQPTPSLSQILEKTTLDQAESTLERLQNEVSMWEVIVSAIRARDKGKKRRKTKAEPPVVLADPVGGDSEFGSLAEPEQPTLEDWQTAANKCNELSMRSIPLIVKVGDNAKDWARSSTALGAELRERKTLRPDDVEFLERVEGEIKAAEG